MKRSILFSVTALLLSMMLYSCSKNIDETPEPKDDIAHEAFVDVQGEDHSYLFDKNQIKANIINDLRASETEEFNSSDLTNLIQTDHMQILKNGDDYVVIVEWVDEGGESMGYASKIAIGSNLQAELAEGGCISRGCSCTLKYCSCLATSGECERPWSPPTE